MKLPISVNPCPIVEAVFEVRFETTVPKSAVFGIFYGELKQWLGANPIDLPILQIPEKIRQQDPSFKFKTYYEFKNESLTLQIGPDVCMVSMKDNYTGWMNFSKEIFFLLELLIKPGIISSFKRVAFRYINFFEEEIYNSINLDIHLNGKPIDYNETVLNTSFNHTNFKSNLRISNISAVNGKNGSIIDIDTYSIISMNPTEFKENYNKIVEEGHNEEKQLFYNLLKQEFLQKLNPQY
tara:strand:- start:2219 stop:2932 length:714 start_codon:yes stop_codon:yes gene_type:complete